MAWRAPQEPGDSDPSVAAAKAKLRRYSYGKGLDDSPVYTVEFGVALLLFKTNRNEQILRGDVRGMPGMALNGVLDWAAKKNLEILPTNASPAPTIVPVVFTIQGHMGGMFDGPQYFTARALEDPVRRIDVQPVWYDNTRKPFNMADCVRRADALANDPRELPPGTNWGVTAHSQGSVGFCDWWEQIIEPNRNRWPYSHFKGGINFGNPRRPRGVVDPSIPDPPPPGTEGLDPNPLREAIPGVAEYSRDGDLYANKKPGPAADYKEAVYMAVCRGKLFGADTLGAEIGRLATAFGNPIEVFYVFQAIVSGVSGLITLREHGEFDLRPAVAHLASVLEV